MTAFAFWRALAGSREGEAGSGRREVNTTNRRRDKSGSLRWRKPLLSHGFSRAGRSGAVPRLGLSPTISGMFSALCARTPAGAWP